MPSSLVHTVVHTVVPTVVHTLVQEPAGAVAAGVGVREGGGRMQRVGEELAFCRLDAADEVKEPRADGLRVELHVLERV